MAEAAAVRLVVLAEALLLAILGVIALLVVLLLLVLGCEAATIRLAWLEGLSTGLEGRDTRPEGALRCGGILLVNIQLLLSLTRQVLVLSSGVVFPRVEVGHRVG